MKTITKPKRRPPAKAKPVRPPPRGSAEPITPRESDKPEPSGFAKIHEDWERAQLKVCEAKALKELHHPWYVCARDAIRKFFHDLWIF